MGHLRRPTSMTKTFYRASAFNQDLGEWAVGITTSKGMQAKMFYGASAFDQDSAGAWTTK